MKLFISLGQDDGRLVPGAEHPFPDTIHHTMFMIIPLKDGENPNMKVFDKSRIKKCTFSKIIEYKENCLDVANGLEAGRYLIVPSCKTAGDMGNFCLNIYYGPWDHTESGNLNDQNFSAKYLNPIPENK